MGADVWECWEISLPASVLPKSYLPHAAPSPCTLWFRSPSWWESSLPVGIPKGHSLFGEFCWFWWQHCCQSWFLLLCSTVGWGGGADQEGLALTWLCCAGFCILEHPGPCGTIRLGRGQAASLGSSQELFAGSGADVLQHRDFCTQLWGVLQCLVPFLSSSLCPGGRQCVH